MESIVLTINNTSFELVAEPDTPLLYILHNNLGLKGPKYGCGLEQCNACLVLIDGQDVPSCKLPVSQAAGLAITTVEGLGTPYSPHPLQEAFIEEQAIQCGYCAPGMIIAAQGLLNRVRYPTNDQIREALSGNIYRCGVHERVRRAIRMRVGRPDDKLLYEVVDMAPLTETQPAPPANSDLPPSLLSHPELDSWIQINANETITIFSGKVEIGQGIQTAVAQLAAEELDVNLARIRVVSGDTAVTPDEGVTAGSMSLQTSWAAIRVSSAEARQHLLALAFEVLEAETAASALVVKDDTITDIRNSEVVIADLPSSQGKRLSCGSCQMK
jgi:nicotinate dehydrogenase subunit A